MHLHILQDRRICSSKIKVISCILLEKLKSPCRCLKTAFSILRPRFLSPWSKDIQLAGIHLPFSLKGGIRSYAMETIEKVEIDGPGNTFKYILLKLIITKGGSADTKDNSQILVRGYTECPFHGDIFDVAQDRLNKKLGKDVTFKLNCLGGGRIKHEANKIHIYGYSQGYGRADHSITSDLIKAAFSGKNYEVTWSDEGY